MPKRGMNNDEKRAASILKQNGFTIFWQENNNPPNYGNWWAIHPELICQYCLRSVDVAIEDLIKKRAHTLKRRAVS